MADKELLINFLKQIDNIFPIPLSKKVHIEDYAAKALSKGVAICAENSENIIGIILGYANDEVAKKAYIGTLGVVEEYRLHGVGKTLLNNMKDISRIKGMEEISLYAHRSNESAIRFYMMNGFIRVPSPLPERADDIYFWARL